MSECGILNIYSRDVLVSETPNTNIFLFENLYNYETAWNLFLDNLSRGKDLLQ